MVEMIGIEPTTSLSSLFTKKIPLFSEGLNRMEVFYSQFISNINFLSSQSYLRRGTKNPSEEVQRD
jgi:hypothetical protein